jgi:HK97 gp10 family phage protein
MPIKTRITTKGFAEYLERVVKAGNDVDAVAGEALAAGGEILLSGMEQRVARDTGNLAENLECSEPKQDGNFIYIEVGLLNPDADTARYGNVQEFGSATTAAQPYIRPTLDSDMGKARAAMRKVFEEKSVI